MSVLLIIGIVVALWIGLCVLVVALCVSAKDGDGVDATRAPARVARPRRRRSRRTAPALS